MKLPKTFIKKVGKSTIRARIWRDGSGYYAVKDKNGPSLCEESGLLPFWIEDLEKDVEIRQQALDFLKDINKKIGHLIKQEE